MWCQSELRKLQDTIAAISALLREAEKRQVEAEDVKDWLKKLKDVVYDADDLLDDFSTEALRRRRVTGRGKRILNEVHIFFSSSNQLIYASKMAHRVMEIRGRIDAIKSDKFDYNVSRSNNLGSFVENRPRPQTYPFDSEPYVIGRENDKKQVVQFLLNPDFEENVSILAIVGVGGLGKTTLARLVFNDESIQKYFELKLWVCVSTNFCVEDILRKIKRECTSGKDLTSMNAVGSQNVLGEELHKKKYLLVLDDVWNENRYEWLKLEGLLVNSARGSKILVTARSRRVATTMTRTFHELSGLPEHDSLTLLMRMAMKHEHELRNQKLDAIAKEILKKCAGVPLAIMTIGRLLLFLSNNEEEWLNFNNNDLSRIDQKEGDIMPSLKLSYDFLPSHLKQCFAYCSLFPKDYELDPLELIYLWMAQGFIRPLDNKKTVEEVGYDYFMELLSRSFFQDIQEDHYGNIVRCKMHDLMHDLAESVAGDICITIDSSHAKSFPKGARHVSITFDLDEIKGFERDQRIRSLFLMVEKRILIAHLEVSYFRNLRALRIRAVNIKAISKSISKLKHLRSLDLSENKELTSLPNSISRLCNLEILNLSSCHKLKGLPRGITKLVNLRQLDLIDCYALTHMPRGIGKLTSLQMLNVFVVGKKSNRNAARLNELSRLAGILLRNKGLIIEGLENVESISSEVDASFSMEKLAIQKLGLHWCPDEVRANAEEVLQRLRPHRDIRGLDILGYDGVRLPSWLSQLHDLVEIRIFVCQQCNHLPPLDHLPFLKKICLDSLDNLECVELSESSGTLQSFYPSLKEIELYNLDKFKGWERRSRRDNRIEQEEDIREEEEEDHSSSYMLCKFVDNVKIDIDSCPKFSYMQGEQLHVSVTTIKLLEQLLRNAADHSDPQPGHHPTNLPSLAVPNPSTSKMTFISITSIPVSALTSLAIDSMNDADHLPMELFQSVPSLKSLAISNWSRLKALSGRAILRYLPALEKLEIYNCEELDLSTEDDDEDDGCGGGEGMHQLQGGHKLRQITITEVHKTRSLPGWFQYLPNLQELTIETCFGLKSLPRRLFLPLLTTLESLSLCDCPELDLSRTGESGDQQDMSNLQFAKLRDLSFWGEKMETLPWWIQHLTNLESLSIRRCTDLKAMPEWFPQLTSLQYLEVYGCEKELTRRCKRKTGEDWPKISHIPRLYVV
ncbi:putative disease resistance protein RGA1 [Punica granatum]|uniref:Disease resistance protein RGA1 n=1 Tax=Punica granatum TaxID=22663 RepID=A0A218XPE2_PUNGR|nr:putative disease resistance protein RGA1 [Punica granatum]XP_031375187.1 putative disease resistance protein RGA1 [Punica granatum]XP_031375188.1 putative disease resistance protein RGA1 [Punica granatum]XP_031375189.1 putative disease resistance protein RGA1 [Punica granatum]XP_031375190.1 putative disease resistance protein RGA1 [Punica granatum]XP_031375191.1 putative disease resistance protein RGA1 [Punica granatum]XP_031375193.1 putative disease resistance protein RGA1 [Punica granatu